MEPAREAEEEEIDVIWDENGTARYRILKDNRIVDFDGHNLAWLDEQGNVIDYDGRHMAFYENGIMRPPQQGTYSTGDQSGSRSKKIEAPEGLEEATSVIALVPEDARRALARLQEP